MRIDKFLKVSRILKRRTLAQQASDNGRVVVNGRVVKPSYRVKVGDVVELNYNSGTFRFEILDLKETVRKEQAELLYKVLEN
ncbi:MAG: RNA-binding S4 domain-containing protein [Clostridia bacterium]|nr:RNA-binding S4 domain-containing protein [Clostridia bacterium]